MRFKEFNSRHGKNDCIIILSSHIVIADIETIADEASPLRERTGTLITKGTQADVVKAVDGKVFEIVVDSASADAFKTNYQVINSIRQKEKTRMRYISDQPTEGSSACTGFGLERCLIYCLPGQTTAADMKYKTISIIS